MPSSVLMFWLLVLSAQRDCSTKFEARVLSSVNRTIQFPSLPGYYPPSHRQTWSMVFDTVVKFVVNITNLALEHSNGCKADALLLSIPSQTGYVGTFCGHTTSYSYDLVFDLLSYGLDIEFYSDQSVQDRGFSVHVDGRPMDGDEICAMMFNQTTNQISSRLWRLDRYPALLNCSWVFEAPSGNQVVLDFSRFDIEYSGPDCMCDRIEVWTTSFPESSQRGHVATLCGRRDPWTLETGSAAVIVRFVTDQADNRKGFHVNLRNAARTRNLNTGRYLKAIPRPQTFLLSSRIETETMLEWRIRTHPGYRIQAFYEEPTHGGTLRFYDGPDAAFDEASRIKNGLAVTEGFLMSIQARLSTGVAPSNISYVASDYITSVATYMFHGEFDFARSGSASFQHGEYIAFLVSSGRHARVAIQGYNLLRSAPNTDDCEYSGVAFYDGVVTFDGLIGPFCDISVDYTTELFKKLIASTSVLYVILYHYSLPSSGSWIPGQIYSQSTSCRGYQVTEWMFKTGRVVVDMSLKLDVYEKGNTRRILIEYQQFADDCIVIQLLPYMSQSTDLEISFTGQFSYRICRQWGLRNQTNGISNFERPKTKYTSQEHCTLQKYVSVNEITTVTEPLNTVSEWSKEYIRVEIGNVSDNVCSEILCKLGEDNIVPLSCGYIKELSNGCELLLVDPEDGHAGRHMWELRIGLLIPTSKYDDAFIDISEIPSDLRQTVRTRISHFQLGTLRALYFRSVSGMRVKISGRNIRHVDIEFKQELMFESDKSLSTKTTLSGSPCVVYKRHCYVIYNHSRSTSWDLARKNCVKEGGYLLSINTVDELDFVKRQLDTHWEGQFYGNNRGLVFIGLTDTLKVGDHRWEDGSPLSVSDWYYPFAHFHSVLPQNPKPPLDLSKIQPVKDTAQRCVAMVPGNSIYSTNWRKVPCGNNSYPSNVYSICEIEMSVVSEGEANQSPEDELNNKPSGMRCLSGMTFVHGRCFMILTNQNGIAQPLSRDSAQALCAQSDSVLARVDRIPREYVLDFLTSVGFRPGSGDIWVELASLKPGCISLSILKDTRLFNERMLLTRSTCQSSDGFAIHALCESDLLPIQPTCEPQQFSCHDGTCLNPDRVCDRFPDCSEGEDEDQCDAPNYTYHCNDGEQIPILRYCDFHVDCEDGSDESECFYPNCTQSEYRCDNGQCIPASYQCDAEDDCRDGSDESFCDYETYCLEFKCPVFGCVRWSQVEDLVTDCPDGTDSDEVFNPRHHKRFNFFVRTAEGNHAVENMDAECPHNAAYQRCNTDHIRCYPRAKACIYDHDTDGNLLYCRNGAHLQHCREHECPDMFKCPESYCIPHHKVCDGVQDCTRGEDEVHCENRTCPHQLKCGRTNQCVSQQYVCDGQVHCKSGYDDELFCDLYGSFCPINCTCYGYIINCQSNSYDAVPYLVASTRTLDLSGNLVSFLNGSTFSHLTYLLHLYLQLNKLQSICPGTFQLNKNLLSLDLSYNAIERISKGSFYGLVKLQSLSLRGNPIIQMSEGSFLDLSSLSTLNLNGMQLTELTNGSLVGLAELNSLDLSNNSIKYIHNLAMVPTFRLSFLNLESNPLDETTTATFGALRVKTLRVDSYFVCCYVSEAVTDCYPPLDKYTSCSDLLGSSAIQAIVWTFAVLALIGNSGVIFWRLKTKLRTVPSILVLNLSISDLLMGIYLLGLAIADLQLKGSYALNDHKWRHSVPCLVIGAVATISCEMSTFTLVCIAVDRTKRLAYPFTSGQFNKNTAVLTLLIGWIVCVLVSVAPFAVPSYFGHYYSRNSVCVPFNFSDPLGKGWGFSFFLFVVLNAISVLLIVVMYGLTYAKVRETQSQAGREDRIDLDVARKLTLVIMTDMLCVIPLTVTNLISSLGEPINRDMASVITAVILPINSALNPYLFTFSGVRSS